MGAPPHDPLSSWLEIISEFALWGREPGFFWGFLILSVPSDRLFRFPRLIVERIMEGQVETGLFLCLALFLLFWVNEMSAVHYTHCCFAIVAPSSY